MTGIAMDTGKNLLTIGGNPCLEATHVSISLVDPNYSTTTSGATSYLMGEENVSCELRETPPGKYRPFLHVAGRGWALVTEESVVEVVPAIGPDPTHLVGSLRGGLELSIHVRGSFCSGCNEDKRFHREYTLSHSAYRRWDGARFMHHTACAGRRVLVRPIGGWGSGALESTDRLL